MNEVVSVNKALPFDDGNVNWKISTKADRIRSMTDEELAMWMRLRGCPTEEINMSCMNNKTKEKSCTRCWLDWLKSPVEVGE